MVFKVVNNDNLDGQHFIGVQKNNGATELQVRISRDNRNTLKVKEDGLFATTVNLDNLTPTTIKIYNIPDLYFPPSFRNNASVTVDKRLYIYGNLIVLKMKLTKGIINTSGWELQHTQIIWPENLTGAIPLNVSWQGKTTSSGNLILNGANRFAWTGATMESSLMATGTGMTIVEDTTVPSDFTLIKEITLVNKNPTPPAPPAPVEPMILSGPGRPDQPDSTGGIIKGNEKVGIEYNSTDGANVGAYKWIKRPDGWRVIYGDTGWRKITSPRFTKGYIKIRRINDSVRVNVGGGDWDSIALNNFDPTNKNNPYRIDLGRVPMGFQTVTTALGNFTYDGQFDLGYFIFTSIADSSFIQFRIRNTPDANYKSLIRVTELSYFTDQAWPTDLNNLPPI